MKPEAELAAGGDITVQDGLPSKPGHNNIPVKEESSGSLASMYRRGLSLWAGQVVQLILRRRCWRGGNASAEGNAQRLTKTARRLPQGGC